ncbi:hypothetical protein D3C73_1097880 [compost metagenome]
MASRPRGRRGQPLSKGHGIRKTRELPQAGLDQRRHGHAGLCAPTRGAAGRVANQAGQAGQARRINPQTRAGGQRIRPRRALQRHHHAVLGAQRARMGHVGIARGRQDGLRTARTVLAQIIDLPLAQQLQALHKSGPWRLRGPPTKQESAPGWLHDYNSFLLQIRFSRIQCPALLLAPMTF